VVVASLRPSRSPHPPQRVQGGCPGPFLETAHLALNQATPFRVSDQLLVELAMPAHREGHSRTDIPEDTQSGGRPGALGELKPAFAASAPINAPGVDQVERCCVEETVPIVIRERSRRVFDADPDGPGQNLGGQKNRLADERLLPSANQLDEGKSDPPTHPVVTALDQAVEDLEVPPKAIGAGLKHRLLEDRPPVLLDGWPVARNGRA
jgi:hypothetical protein